MSARPLYAWNISPHFFDYGPNKLKRELNKITCNPSSEGASQLLLAWYRARQSDPNIEQSASKAETRISALPSANYSTYHEVLAQLKHHEFKNQSRSVSKANQPKGLEDLREQAATLAACEYAACAYWNKHQLIQNTYKIRRMPDYGASIVPFLPYIRPGPYYLWDKVRGEVWIYDEVCRTEKAIPDYVAISHTWVRWTIDSDPVKIPGVQWAIPPNSRLDVTKLTTELSALPWRYFWIDLLTIPQGNLMTLDQVMYDRRVTEINYIPEIFRRASKAIAWFDDIPSWTHLPSALEYISLRYLSASERADLDTQKLACSLSDATTSADNPLELLRHDAHRRAPQKDIWEPNGMFTSPWSLQEMIIRPDLMLCSGDWQFLELAPGIPIALNDIAAFLRVVPEEPGEPLSIQDLRQLFDRVGMMHLLHVSSDTSVELKDDIDGIAPADGRGYPCIVPRDGPSNPHRLLEPGEPRPFEQD
jgi:hypothetical protein